MPFSGFRQTLENLENLEKQSILEKIRETQGNPGNKKFLLPILRETQGISFQGSD